ncbi:MAG: hypothetical protein RLZZ502_1562 [Pseudomonadota bacterium]|jgi:biotin-dependent carboxylase-like uncharacterized protein
MLEILSHGALNSIQDLGRRAYLAQGVSLSGAMDAEALCLANLMVGNAPEAAAIEINVFPFRVRFLTAQWFACAGAFGQVSHNARAHQGWWSAQAQAGDEVQIAAPEQGTRSYFAVRGGFAVPEVLGSCSTELKSGFGGWQGRALKKNDRLHMHPCEPLARQQAQFGLMPQSRLAGLAMNPPLVRVIAGAEYGCFKAEALRDFEHTDHQLSPECNRQGLRLQGPTLRLAQPLELLSHGIVPGTIQVPPSGQAIIQMAEANTCGGYPKIATVISSDLWRVAQLRPGQSLRFQVIEHAQAVEIMRAQALEMHKLSEVLRMGNQRTTG